MHTFDYVLDRHILPMGKWQGIILFFSFFTAFPIIFFQTLAHAPPPHRCRIPSLDNNSHFTWEQVRRLAIPDKPKDKAPAPYQAFQPCERLELPFSTLRLLNFSSAQAAVSALNATRNGSVGVVACDAGFEYDESHAAYRRSVGREFDLVCERAPLLTLASAVYMPGMTAGLLVAGYTADWAGRRRAMIVFGFFNLAVTLATPLSPNVHVYALMRFLTAMSGNAHGITGFVLWLEILDDKYRTLFNVLSNLYYATVSRGVFTLMAWLIQDWRWLAFSMNWTLLVVFLYPTPLLTESPRWLLSRGYTERAQALIRRVVARNRGERYAREQEAVDPDVFKCDSTWTPGGQSEARSRRAEVWAKAKRVARGVSVLFVTPRVRRLSLLSITLFSCQVVAYYAVSFYAIHVRGNAYLISFAEGLMAVPACVMMYFLFRYFKRRGPIMTMHGLSALVCFGTALMIYLQERGSIGVVVLANVVICLEETAFDMMYIHLPECFPTEIRNTALSTSSALARIAGMSASYIEQLDSTVWPPLPMLVIGALCVCMVVLVYLLPETKGVSLTDTVVELEMKSVVTFKRDPNDICESTVNLIGHDDQYETEDSEHTFDARDL